MIKQQVRKVLIEKLEMNVKFNCGNEDVNIFLKTYLGFARAETFVFL